MPTNICQQFAFAIATSVAPGPQFARRTGTRIAIRACPRPSAYTLLLIAGYTSDARWSGAPRRRQGSTGSSHYEMTRVNPAYALAGGCVNSGFCDVKAFERLRTMTSPITGFLARVGVSGFVAETCKRGG